jgi:type II secretory pathway component GspD/PulD (secretin)
MTKIIKFGFFAITFIAITALSTVNASNITYSNFSDKAKTTIKGNNGEEVNSEKDKKPETKKITFNFPNTELVVFARFVAKLCGKTLIGEDLLKGNISIQSENEMDLQQVTEVFKKLLNSNGLEFVQTNVYMEIIPRVNSEVKVYEIKYLKSSDIARSLNQIFRMSFRVGNKPANIQITSVDNANVIMVLAPKSLQLEIEKSIKKLDTRSRQVLLNIKIIELTRDSVFGFGVSFNLDNGFGIIAGNSEFDPANGSVGTFSTKSVSSAAGYNYNRGGADFTVQGVDKKTKIKVLSQPRIMARENQKAQIKIGEKHNYISGSSSLGGDDNNVGITQTTSMNELGIEIEITPRISKKNNVVLELKLNVANIQGQYEFKSSSTDSDSDPSKIPIVGTRTINNTSSVLDGETLVIGGLLKNQKITTTLSPPVLGDIPLVGWMFNKESEVSEQTELLILITPTVIDSTAANRVALKEETNKLREYDPKMKTTIDQMLTGKKSKTDDVFNMFDYFSDGKYRKEQHFIPQPENFCTQGLVLDY